MTEVLAPMFISARLMAAYKIPDVGTIHLHAEGRDGEGRIVYRHVIEDAEGTLLEEGADLRSGTHEDANYLSAMETMLSFLEHAAEVGPDDADGALFEPATTAWAQAHSDELGMARSDIDTDPGNHGEYCTTCPTSDEPHLPTYE